MQSLLQALNIGTLATWLSVSGASTVAFLVPFGDRQSTVERDLNLTEGEVIDLDAESSEPAAGSPSPADATVEPEAADTPPVPVETVPPPPDLAGVMPLPEIPDLPEPKADDLQSSQPKPQTRSAPARKASMMAAKARPTGTPGATGAGTGSGGGLAVGSGSGSAGTGAARLSKGRIPTPKYPEDCRKNNQEGRVVVTFTVDEAGNVVSAKVTGKSAFATMDQAALDAVYRGKFPAGPRASASKAIVFKLR